jgi:hypothetical protein
MDVVTTARHHAQSSQVTTNNVGDSGELHGGRRMMSKGARPPRGELWRHSHDAGIDGEHLEKRAECSRKMARALRALKRLLNKRTHHAHKLFGEASVE